jgi:hypothetical protein
MATQSIPLMQLPPALPQAPINTNLHEAVAYATEAADRDGFAMTVHYNPGTGYWLDNAIYGWPLHGREQLLTVLPAGYFM